LLREELLLQDQVLQGKVLQVQVLQGKVLQVQVLQGKVLQGEVLQGKVLQVLQVLQVLLRSRLLRCPGPLCPGLRLPLIARHGPAERPQAFPSGNKISFA
jgi:hypothetical protein